LVVHGLVASRHLARRSAAALRRRPSDFSTLIDGVCGSRELRFPEALAAAAMVLR